MTSTVNPPDGHWHRRTPKPVKTKWNGKARLHGCTENDCDWTVIIEAGRPERYPARGDGTTVVNTDTGELVDLTEDT